MEQCNEALLSRFIELENEIQTICEPDKLTWSTVREAQQKLSAITRKLNNIHNSKLTINRIVPDVLYNIFTLAVYESSRPWKAVLNISYVCHHWRKSALGWPSLWGPLDLNVSDAILDLFIGRSKDAPVTLSIQSPYRSLSDFLESRADTILPRLRSLSLHLLWSQLSKVGDDLQKFQVQPLQLQHLNITLFPARLTESRPFTLNMDASCLRELRLSEVHLPWLELPSNKLTHCTLWYPVNPPTLPQFLVFLSSCPFLSTLVFGIRDSVDVGLEPATSLTPNPLCLPNLGELVLESRGSNIASYEYVHQFLAHIRFLKHLSQFTLCYYDFKGEEPNPDKDDEEDSGSDVDPAPVFSLPFTIFESVPLGIFSRFAAHRYLYISVDLSQGSFLILSGPEFTPYHQNYPLRLEGSCEYDHFPISELVCAMPGIVRLSLYFQAWELVFRNVDISNAFPCLDVLELNWPDVHRRRYDHHVGRKNRASSRRNQILELQWPDWTCPVLSSPQVNLKLKTLIVSNCYPFSMRDVSDVVLKTGAEVLELGYYYKDSEAEEVISDLRQKGVVVVPIDRCNHSYVH